MKEENMKGYHCQECGQYLPEAATPHNFEDCQRYQAQILKERGYCHSSIYNDAVVLIGEIAGWTQECFVFNEKTSTELAERAGRIIAALKNESVMNLEIPKSQDFRQGDLV